MLKTFTEFEIVEQIHNILANMSCNSTCGRCSAGLPQI